MTKDEAEAYAPIPLQIHTTEGKVYEFNFWGRICDFQMHLVEIGRMATEWGFRVPGAVLTPNIITKVAWSPDLEALGKEAWDAVYGKKERP